MRDEVYFYFAGNGHLVCKAVYATAWDFYKIMQRVRTLLPVEDVNIYYHDIMWKPTESSSFEHFDFYEIIVDGEPKRPEADLAFSMLAEKAS